MTLSTSIRSDLRSRASFLPPCPCCSFVGVTDFPDRITGPTHREFRGVAKLDGCCSLSATTEQFESQAAAAQWWRAKRLEPVKDPATERRRLNCLRKLALAELEPIE